MTASLLIKISNVLASLENYCILCLRTDEERRLESPKQITQFLQTMGQHYPFKFPFQKVCYVCERQAALANRLLISADASVRAHTLALQLNQTPSQFTTLTEALQADPHDVAQSSQRPSWLRQMLECESKLRQQRLKTQLLKTDVLLLSSEQTKTLTVKYNEPRDSYVLPDVASRNERDTFDLNDKHTMLESIKTLDDEDIQNDPKNTERNYPHNSTETENPIEQYFIAAQGITDNADTINVSLHPIVVNNGITVPSLSAHFQNGQLVETATNTPIQSQIAVQTGELISFVTDPNEISDTLKKLNETMQVSEDVGNESNFEVFVKEPKLRSDRIDWEDKIPMDVISFFDEKNEKDVCYNKRKRNAIPEIGICNVTSLQHAQAQCEVVDLCSGPDLKGGGPPHLPPLTAGRRRKRQLKKHLES